MRNIFFIISFKLRKTLMFLKKKINSKVMYIKIINNYETIITQRNYMYHCRKILTILPKEYKHKVT